MDLGSLQPTRPLDNLQHRPELALLGDRVQPVTASPVHLRHVLEVSMWEAIAPPPRAPHVDVAVAALACATAIRYVDVLPLAESAAAREALPAWFQHLHRGVREREGDALGIASLLVSYSSLSLDPEARLEAIALVADLLDAAAPVERLLTIGGDSRVVADTASRLNKYGCSAVPTSASEAWSSCTASSTSELTYRAAEEARRDLLRRAVSASSFRDAFAYAIEDLRSDLADALGLSGAPGAEIVLAASGTDCELYALQLALSAADRDLVSIVIAPDEIGGGSLAAAGGRHFDSRAPLASKVAAGTHIAGIDAHRVRVESVPIRTASGDPIPLDELDETVCRLARNAVRNGRRVLLHVVDGSKTGLRAPSFEAVRRLTRELGDALDVVVDAAQMRSRCSTLVECVASGWMVMVSGSKFFGGPPFSGALLVPAEIAARAASLECVATGLGAYGSAFDVPAGWTAFKATLPETPNLGLLARWRAALSEILAFHSLDERERDERIAARCCQLRAALAEHSFEMVASPVGDRDGLGEGWDNDQTIFTFIASKADRTGARTALDFDEAWQIYVWLNRDLSSLLPPHASHAERGLAAVHCHIGQPVRMKWHDGSTKGALRLAVGAPAVRQSASTTIHAVEKIQMMLRYWDQLTGRRAVA